MQELTIFIRALIRGQIPSCSHHVNYILQSSVSHGHSERIPKTGYHAEKPMRLFFTGYMYEYRLKERARFIYKATKQHALNLAKFVTIYKTVLLMQRKVINQGQKEKSWDTFIAGLVGGWFVFGNRNAVNEQVCSPLLVLVSVEVVRLSLPPFNRSDRSLRSIKSSLVNAAKSVTSSLICLICTRYILHSTRSHLQSTYTTRLSLPEDTTSRQCRFQSIRRNSMGRSHVAVQE